MIPPTNYNKDNMKTVYLSQKDYDRLVETLSQPPSRSEQLARLFKQNHILKVNKETNDQHNQR